VRDDHVTLEAAGFPPGLRTAATSWVGELGAWKLGIVCPLAPTSCTVGMPRSEQGLPAVLVNNTAPAGEVEEPPMVVKSMDADTDEAEQAAVCA
jgi:hypothetical protein